MKRSFSLICSIIAMAAAGCATTDSPTKSATIPSSTSFNPPSPIYMTRPEMPAVVKAASVHGTVIVEWLVGESGNVKEVTILRSPDGRLSSLVSQAVLNWRFKPATKDGIPVEDRMQMVMNFE